MQQPVLNFVADAAGYRFWTQSGERMDVIRCSALQPPIEDPEDYCTYMFVRTQHGYFLMSQRIKERQPQDWSLVKQIEPRGDRPDFFSEYEELLEETLTSVSPPESRCPHSTEEGSPE